MGWGDEIIVTAQARELQRRDPRPVMVIDARGRPRWSDLWEHNPRIIRERRSGGCQLLLNGPGARPYIAAKGATHWSWKPFRCEPGEIYLTVEERAFAERWRGRVLIQPNVKPKPEAVNKQWIWPRWQALVDMGLADMVQVGPPGTRLLDRVKHADTPTFRLACAVLSVCRAYVGTEGGLHHAAAALGVPAVVLFGGFISPEMTGYETHRNLYRGGAPCGARLPCQHCSEAMQAITADEVAHHLKALL